MRVARFFINMSQIPATPIRQIFLILLIAGIFGVLFWNLHFFVPALLGAYTLYVLLRSSLFLMTERWKWPRKVAAAALLLLSFISILLPIQWMFVMLQGRVITLFQNADQLRQNAETLIRTIETRYEISLLTPENMANLSNWTVGAAQGLVGATVNGLGLLLATYFILWFMLTEGKKMEQSFFNWMPLRHENVTFVRKQLNDMVWGNALGIPLMGLVQAVAGLLIYWLVGVPDIWMWFAVTLVGGMVPLGGAVPMGCCMGSLLWALLTISPGCG